MCGIFGFYGKFDLDALKIGLAAIAHRGPDDSGLFQDAEAGVGLAHARLSIIDLSPLGHQPMTDETGRYTIVYNGEIYNFRELRAELETKGCRFSGGSDTEVLLKLYREIGPAMLPRLDGIFAFAVYDSISRELFLACDSMGVKPLYYAESRDGFTFASELKALVAAGCISNSIDVESLFRYLGFLWCPNGGTPFKDVFRLGPGEALRIRQGKLLRRWKWADAFWPNNQGLASIEPAEAVRQVSDVLRNAVHRQMISDVPVGAFLSGGLDSSAVVAMAREVAPDIACFTIDTGGVIDSGVIDDLPYARNVARHLGVKLYEIRVNSAQMAADFDRMVFQIDEPLADPAPLNVLYISRLAKEHGVKVLLSGAGGDDLFAGYRRHRALLMEQLWSWLPLGARRLLRRSSAYLDQRSETLRRVSKAFAYADATANRRLAAYFLWMSPERIRGLFASEHRALLTADSILAPMEEYLRQLPSNLSPLQQMLALEQRFFLADHNLLYTDKMTMAVGVEVRVPYLANEMVHLANSLPPSLKLRGQEGKWVLKRAMASYLPKEVIYRPKTGFGAPVRHWLRNELREWVGDMLSPDTLQRRGLFDPVAVDSLIEDDWAGRVDAAYTILGLVCIEAWCKHFLARVERRPFSGVAEHFGCQGVMGLK